MEQAYTVAGSQITVGGHTLEFPHPIKKTEMWNGNIIVLLDIPRDSEEIDNLYCINRAGELVWQSQSLKEIYPTGRTQRPKDLSSSWLVLLPYLELHIKEREIITNDFYGRTYFIDPENGKIIRREIHRF